MFGFLKNRNKRFYQVPEWANYFSTGEFNEFIICIEQYFKNSKTNFDINRGVIEVAEVFGTGNQLGLSNLASICHQTRQNNWKHVINDHFNNMLEGQKEETELKKIIDNFEQISGYLALRIWPKSYLETAIKDELVYKEKIEELVTVLVLDLPRTVRSIKIEETKKWNKSVDELFEIGKENVLKKYPVQIDREMINEKPCYLLHGEHFFVSIQALILEKHPKCIGKYGAIVAFPHRHMVMVYPINGKDIIKSSSNLMAAATGMYNQGPGAISPNIYWYRTGTFAKLPYEVKEGKIQFTPPHDFIALLEQIVKD
jgi:hypothetical protein